MTDRLRGMHPALGADYGQLEARVLASLDPYQLKELSMTETQPQADQTNATPEPKSETIKVEAPKTQELLVTDHQKKLMKLWEQTHPGTPPPITAGPNGLALWKTRRERRAEASRARKQKN